MKMLILGAAIGCSLVGVLWFVYCIGEDTKEPKGRIDQIGENFDRIVYEIDLLDDMNIESVLRELGGPELGWHRDDFRLFKYYKNDSGRFVQNNQLVSIYFNANGSHSKTVIESVLVGP